MVEYQIDLLPGQLEWVDVLLFLLTFYLEDILREEMLLREEDFVNGFLLFLCFNELVLLNFRNIITLLDLLIVQLRQHFPVVLS